MNGVENLNVSMSAANCFPSCSLLVPNMPPARQSSLEFSVLHIKFDHTMKVHLLLQGSGLSLKRRNVRLKTIQVYVYRYMFSQQPGIDSRKDLWSSYKSWCRCGRACGGRMLGRSCSHSMRRRRRKFTTSVQPAKAYEDESVIMSRPHSPWPKS